MNEAIRNAALLLWAFCAVNNDAYAAVPAIREENIPPAQAVIIYGASSKAPGVRDSATVEMPVGEGNVMGEPIDTSGFQSASDVTPSLDPTPVKPVHSEDTTPENTITETLPQNPPISPEESPQKVNEQIQNTLYESGDRIYDVQSYPVNDIDTITQPNTQPTINSYPSY